MIIICMWNCLHKTTRNLKNESESSHENLFAKGKSPAVEIFSNGASVGRWDLERTGLFVLEADLPAADKYELRIEASPVWEPKDDQRPLTVTISMVRLVPRDS